MTAETYSHLLPGERLDDLQLSGLYLIQNPSRFRFGSDAVCLSNFAVVRKHETVLDLCAGTGAIPILLSAKTEGRFFTGLELQPDIADMARRSVSLNGLEARVRIDEGDIKQAPVLYGTGVFDVVTVNPPYMRACKVNDSEAVALARHEIACTLEDVVSAAARVLRTGGRLYMVHRPHRLADVCCTLRAHKLEPKTLQMVQSAEGKKPVLMLVEAVSDGKPWLAVPAPLILS